ncbi:DUF4038 domain-containing protein [Culicoidibacter larvae]|uniref:DUF4038 domain-containing protein n=1 Tax=Culicoidibacter larvae TaxID=2579976 RepID=A0A5R8QBL2_9FIRM|nr:DUF4038 domain-containing protein [Culicoidibacter larvae]TLG73969.1 DUF4038 domain-containing protein [Culicoidibacter larvae]
MFDISKDKRYFLVDGEPGFYLADTCWSAFTNISDEDWQYYLSVRKQQGFNVIQINMLWQWDSSATNLALLPFGKNADGTFDFSKRNDAYFDRAVRMVAQARDYGITVALVLLWCNYLPDTWATKLKATSLFPLDLVEEYAEYIAQRFAKYQPIYIISGDTDFPNDTVIEYYERALNAVKRVDPNGLTTLHIQGRADSLPKRLQNNSGLDFYMYQSGHNSAYQETTYLLAEKFAGEQPQKPVINSEPCYEQMGYSRKVYGRFNRFDVRRAAWQSVLSGASAGVTYGAHGIWSWHTASEDFDSSVGEAFEPPYDWHTALHFEGAWDYAYIKTFFESHHLHDIKPCQDIILGSPEIRAAQHEQAIYIYLPSNIKLQLKGDYQQYKISAVHLETKQTSMLDAKYNEDKQITTLAMHPFIGDALYILEK